MTILSFHGINHFKNSLAHCIGFLVCICKRCSLNAIIEFNLRLCSGRSYAQPCIIGKIIVENIGIRKSCRLLLTCCKICDLIQLVVTCRQSPYSPAISAGGFCTKCFHDLLDLCQTFNSFQGDGLNVILIVAVTPHTYRSLHPRESLPCVL